MKKITLATLSLVSALALTGCSDDAERSELEQAYIDVRAQTKAALAETKDAIDALEDNQKALEKALEGLDSVMETLGQKIEDADVAPAKPAKESAE